MEICDSKKKLMSSKLQNNCPSDGDIILCNHCKRTSSNGIRCLGMCVADNDYWYVVLTVKLRIDLLNKFINL